MNTWEIHRIEYTRVQVHVVHGYESVSAVLQSLGWEWDVNVIKVIKLEERVNG